MKKISFFLLFAATTYILQPTSSHAVPVSRAQVAQRRGIVIATVDLERVFAAYPATKKAKEELGRLILIKENEIATKRAEVFALTEEIAKLKSTEPAPPAPPPPPETLPGMPASTQTMVTTPLDTPPPSTPTPAMTPEAISQREVDLKRKKEELKLLERGAEKNLEDLEQAKTKTILAQIYIGLRELAQEKGVDMIVDKNSILWGASKLDLTDPLLQKLKHKVIENE